MLTADELLFFVRHGDALPLYETFLERLRPAVDAFSLRVQKTQITLSNRAVFACVSFLPVRKAAARPPVYIVVTFGLGRRAASPRIDAAVEPYPGRWTHHVLVSDAQELDGELLGWVREAYAFAAEKRPRR